MLLFTIFFIVALIFALLGAVYLILYRTFEKSTDKIDTAKAIFIGTKTHLYRGRKIYYPIFEYTVNNKKYRKSVSSHPCKPHRNSEAVYLKSFPCISYIKYSGNHFKEISSSWFICAAISLILSIKYLLF